MTATLTARPGRLPDPTHRALGYLPPNWFAAVMGTGIVAVAAASLPLRPRGLHTAVVVVWVLAAVLLVALLVATAAHWVTRPEVARAHHRHPVVAHFYGAPPMAMLTVGAGTLLLGRDVIGQRPAVVLDTALWTLGTVGGLVTAVAVPVAHARRHRDALPFGGWLMPVVPPMVSASTGALLVPYAAPGTPRLALLVTLYALFTLALVASLGVIALLLHRLVVHGVGEAASVPTLWIVLGPLGQSVTAVNLLAGVAPDVLPGPAAAELRRFGVAYGVPVWGLALLWAVFAATVTVRTARKGLPFTLGWWSFTFPVGTVVTGTSGLALHTGNALFRGAAVVLFAALVAAWATVFVRTGRGLLRGTLLLPPGGVTAGKVSA